mmetsp:Transcript_8174/g.24890  ORF Transcript_8174/g.24890 Transcript_8174/m.24890 type:complete len:255 (-) Transcript_8174:12-776(-)
MRRRGGAQSARLRAREAIASGPARVERPDRRRDLRGRRPRRAARRGSSGIRSTEIRRRAVPRLRLDGPLHSARLRGGGGAGARPEPRQGRKEDAVQLRASLDVRQLGHDVRTEVLASPPRRRRVVVVPRLRRVLQPRHLAGAPRRPQNLAVIRRALLRRHRPGLAPRGDHADELRLAGVHVRRERSDGAAGGGMTTRSEGEAGDGIREVRGRIAATPWLLPRGYSVESPRLPPGLRLGTAAPRGHGVDATHVCV